ncbi:MAG TPA: HNH endonuclease, partial [Anaerovoracaceae bacterium]|nr:HNH endonuclease [Anaerovoracaceae bacterium]
FSISSIEYQQGDQMGFWNVREYVLFRDNHTCQHCKGKSKDKRLNVHHIECRQTGGDSPGNLTVLCETCHNDYHAGKIELKVKRGASFRDAAFMGIMRWAFYNQLKNLYSNVSLTYGYITKNTRILNNIEKTHAADAYSITKNITAKRIESIFYQKFVRHSNRSLHKANLLKGGIRKANKAPTLILGYRIFDKVLFEERECFIFGRRATGYFDLRLLDGASIHKSASHKKLKLLSVSKTLLTERRRQESIVRQGQFLPA